MSMWTIVKETLSILGCDDIESLPEREQALIGECCYHRVPAKAIADLIRALRDPASNLPSASQPEDWIDNADETPCRLPALTGAMGVLPRLLTRRQVWKDDEQGSEGRAFANLRFQPAEN